MAKARCYEPAKEQLRKALREISSRLEERRQIVKLPAIELMKFNGEPQNWVPFKHFKCFMVHLSEPEKMSHLRSNVSHEAWDAIKHFRSDLTQNYMKAWTHLNKRYTNNRKIVQAEIDKLFALPKANNVRKFKTQYNMIIDSLESLKGLNIDTSS